MYFDTWSVNTAFLHLSYPGLHWWASQKAGLYHQFSYQTKKGDFMLEHPPHQETIDDFNAKCDFSPGLSALCIKAARSFP
jgi:hypothetical protein